MRKILSAFGCIGAGIGLLSLSVLLLQSHFQTVKDVREYALPLAADIPLLEKQVETLKEEMELGELQASVRSSTAEEKLRVFVLPQGDDPVRVLAFIESVQTFLEKRKMLRAMSPIEIGELARDRENAKSRAIRWSAELTPEGRHELHEFLGLSGLITVGDAMAPGDIDALLELTRRQNAAGPAAVEKFLSTELVDYAQNPAFHRQRLAQTMPSEEFLLHSTSILDASALTGAVHALTGDLGRTLLARKLWPVQFLTVEKESAEEAATGWIQMALELKAYGRE